MFLRRHKVRLIMLLALLLLLLRWSQPLRGSTEEGQPEGAITLGTMYVVEHRSELDRILDQSPHSVSVIPEDRITGKFTSVADLLSEEVGVRVNQAGGLGSFSTASIRGSTGEQVVVLLDGIPLNEALGGGVNLGNLPTSIIESIEVYRGSAPLSLGVSGIGGVLNIKTKRARGDWSVYAQGQAGSFETYTGSLFLGHKPGDLDYSMAFEHRESKNDFEYLNDRGTPFNPDDDRIENRLNNEFWGNDVSLRAGYDLSVGRLDIVNTFKKTHKGLPGTVGAPAKSAAFETTENLSTLQGTIEAVPGALTLTGKGYYGYKKEHLDDRKGEVGGGSQDTNDVTTSVGGDLVSEYRAAEWNTVSLITRYVHERFDPEDALSRITVPESARDTVSVGMEDKIELLDGSLLLVPSIRFDHVANDLFGTSAGRLIKGEVGERTYDVWTPQFSAKYAPFAFLAFKGNVGRYHRFPSFFELFGNNGTFVGNIDLAPERSLNYDLGAMLSFEDLESAVRYFSIEVTYFRSDVDNLITQEQATGQAATSRQVDSAEISGIEASFRLGLLDVFHLTGNLTYQEAINKGVVKGTKDKQLPQRPVWELGLWARVTLWKIEPFYHYTFIDKNYLNASNIGQVEARHIHDAGISFKPLEWLSTTFEVRNFTDERYEDFYGYPQPGRSYFLTLRVSW